MLSICWRTITVTIDDLFNTRNNEISTTTRFYMYFTGDETLDNDGLDVMFLDESTLLFLIDHSKHIRK